MDLRSGSSALVCVKEDVEMFVDACAIEVESSKETDVINAVAEEEGFEGV